MKTPANAAGRWTGALACHAGSGDGEVLPETPPGDHWNCAARTPRPPAPRISAHQNATDAALPTGLPATSARLTPAAWSRFDRGGEHLHRLGPRAVAEFIAELARAHGIEGAVLDRLAAWRAWPVTPAMLRDLGGDRCPAAPLHLVAS